MTQRSLLVEAVFRSEDKNKPDYRSFIAYTVQNVPNHIIRKISSKITDN